MSSLKSNGTRTQGYSRKILAKRQYIALSYSTADRSLTCGFTCDEAVGVEEEVEAEMRHKTIVVVSMTTSDRRT